ncbi:MAG: tRNA (guanosine(37)-N1)-methyltransferase TrmD [Deltaproteobacteria bacterium]|nr:tRNA (guanosine(37)-N1)-methyltransferase TrmD [Deltaproteobacteria bacterium]
MRFDIISLFPESLDPLFSISLLGKARKKGLVEICLHRLEDYLLPGEDIDDMPFGGGGGMVMKGEPIIRAVRGVRDKNLKGEVILLTPQGETLRHRLVCELADLKQIVLICGRYEGIDERVVELVVDREISIGDFVLSGGEIPALAVVDAVARLVPGVVCGKVPEDSFYDGMLKYPQYTRPRVVEGLPVPEVLLSGNHAEVERWRKEESLERTRRRRPDLVQNPSH